MASPQVRTVEYDLSQRVPQFLGMYGLVIGNFDKGPVNQRVLITNSQQMDLIFGKPAIGSDIAYFVAHSFLFNSQRLWVLRVADQALHGGVMIGSTFNVPIGFGNGSQRTFEGTLPYNRCLPGTVEIYQDMTKVGYDNGSGAIHGQRLNGTVNYLNGQVSITFENPIPTGAVIYARWGFPNISMQTGLAAPQFNWRGREIRLDIAGTFPSYSDRLVPDTLVPPSVDTVTPETATVRIYDDNTLIGYADANGNLVDMGNYFEGNENYVNYANGNIRFRLANQPTRLQARYYSYKSELMLILSSSPCDSSNISIGITNVNPEDNTFIITVYSRNERNVLIQEEQFYVSRSYQKDGFERQMFIEDRINGNSYYIHALSNPFIGDRECVPQDSLNQNSLTERTLNQLSGGSRGITPSIANYIRALRTFNNKEDVKVDIIIDTLGDPNYQVEIARICDRDYGGRADCYGILFMPFEHEESINYINNQLNYINYTLPINTSYCGIYSGFVKIYDGYNGRQLWIPPSGFVASVFSYTADQYEPWYPPAGWRRGRLNVLDVYRHYSLGERDVLYDNNINVIRFRPGKGIAVWGQKTLHRRPSALDRANVRWLLIVIQNAIEEFLEEFQFEINDSLTRKLASSAITDYLESIKNRRGLYDYAVVCDETNNTPEIIDQYIMNVDYYVQPTKAAEYIFGRCIITRTGVKFEDVRITGSNPITSPSGGFGGG